MLEASEVFQRAQFDWSRCHLGQHICFSKRMLREVVFRAAQQKSRTGRRNVLYAVAANCKPMADQDQSEVRR